MEQALRNQYEAQRPKQSDPHPARVSEDVKWIAVMHYLRGDRSMRQVARDLFRDHSTVLSWVRNFENLGYPSRQHPTPTKKLGYVELEYLKLLVLRNPTIYLDELQVQLQERFDCAVSLSTICRGLCMRLKLNRKKITTYNKNKSLVAQTRYWDMMEEMNVQPDMLVFLDETAKDIRDTARLYGRYGSYLVCTPCIGLMLQSGALRHTQEEVSGTPC